MDGGFVLEDRELTGFLDDRVGAELGGNEALDPGFRSGFDQEKLCGDGGTAEGRDDSFLASEGVGERFQGVIVDWDDGDGGGKAMGAAVARQDGDGETIIEKLLEDGWTKIASGLGDSSMSVLRHGGVERESRWILRAG